MISSSLAGWIEKLNWLHMAPGLQNSFVNPLTFHLQSSTESSVDFGRVELQTPDASGCLCSMIEVCNQ